MFEPDLEIFYTKIFTLNIVLIRSCFYDDLVFFYRKKTFSKIKILNSIKIKIVVKILKYFWIKILVKKIYITKFLDLITIKKYLYLFIYITVIANYLY